MKAVSPEVPYIYVCKGDRELSAEEQTHFHLTHLTVEEDAYITNVSTNTDSNGNRTTNLGDLMNAVLSMGLNGLDNLKDDDGNEIVLKRDETRKIIVNKKRPWSTDTLSRIPKDARVELVRVIQNGGELTKEELKN